MRVKCLAQAHGVMFPAKVQTQTAWQVCLRTKLKYIIILCVILTFFILNQPAI